MMRGSYSRIPSAAPGAREGRPQLAGTRGDPEAICSDTMRMRAETAEGETRERLWRAMAALYEGYDEYQKLTSRVIPVVVLKPI